MLNKFSRTSEVYAADIQAKLNLKSSSFIQLYKNLIEDVCVNNASVKDIVFNKAGINMERVCEMAISFFPNSYYDVTLLEKFLKYYYDRLNSYSLTSYKPEDLTNTLKKRELEFLLGENNFKDLNSGKKIDFKKILAFKFSALAKSNIQLMKDKYYLPGDDKISNKINDYANKFNKDGVLNNTIKFMDGRQIVVTQETVDAAYNFTKRKGLFNSASILNSVIRAIGLGNISIDEYKDLDKYSKSDSSLSDADSIDDFLDEIEV